MHGLSGDEAAQRGEELLQLTELAFKAGALVAEYSKGMRRRPRDRRGADPRARAGLLDEPFEGIDVLAAGVIRELLADLSRRNVTLLLTTHVLEIAERLATHAGVIKAGKLVDEGPVGELKARHSADRLDQVFEKLIGCRRARHEALVLRGHREVTAHTAPRFLTHLRLLWGVGSTSGSTAGAAGGFRSSGSSRPARRRSCWDGFLFADGREGDREERRLARVHPQPAVLRHHAVWATWPVMSAGVDDHSEISRYSAFSDLELPAARASTLATMAEPRALVFYGPVTGAALGYLRLHPPTSYVFALMLFVAFVLFNAAVSRVGCTSSSTCCGSSAAPS